MSANSVARQPTAAAQGGNAADVLLDQLAKSLKGDQGAALVKQVKSLIVFKIDGVEWTLNLRADDPDSPTLAKGAPADKPDLTLEMTSAVFAQLVAGKLNPQTAFLMRKLNLSGSMGVAMKLQPVLDAAAPKAKL